MFSKIRTFRGFSNSHKLIFLKIALLVPMVEISIKTMKFKRTLRILNFFSGANRKKPENEIRIVRNYANYLYLYHKQVPTVGKCLARSLSLWFLLRRKGIETDLRFGIRKENDELLAHAWLEFEGEALESRSAFDQNFVPFQQSVLSKSMK